MSDARRAALSALIDHAPTFPPASLPTPDALDEDRRARACEHAWMLARLVWPASRLDELEGEDRALSVLLDGPYRGDLRAEAVESRWGESHGNAGLDGLHGEAYVELPLGDGLEQKVAALAERGLRAKVRCGGAEVPSAEALGAFLSACRAAGVPFKATAGLHHPLVAEGRHGFLNVIAACAFDDGAALSEAVELGADGLRWRDRVADADELARVRREQLVAVGSCSFFEPVDDLRQLGVL
ncbi:MAG TPA: hypothetical protein VEW11_02325 [Gaiellaceae bacterium]|nr:hypothetical protein [Gaiellaceae bacterium]